MDLQRFRLMKRLCQQHRSLSSFLPSVLGSSRRGSFRRMSSPETKDPFCQAKLAIDELIRRYNSQLSMCESVRRWRTLPTAPRRDPGDVQFTLMCYNILAQELLEMHADLYDRHDSVALSWPHRYDRLMAEINLVRPDILCLQELQDDHREQFSNGLANFNYGVLYKKRTGDKPDGCAIFFRRDLFELVDHQDVEYYQPSVKLLDRENVALIAKLQVKGNPTQRLVVATTHLLYNPRRQDVRLAQVQVLLAELDRLAFSGRFANGTPKYTPSIVCGDFNLQPYSAPYMLMTTGYLQYDTLSAKTLEPHGPGSPLGRVLLPPSLGITDDCRHENLTDRANQDDVRATRVSPLNPQNKHHPNHLSPDSSSTTPNAASRARPKPANQPNPSARVPSGTTSSTPRPTGTTSARATRKRPPSSATGSPWTICSTASTSTPAASPSPRAT